jgi:tRNA A37 N6-isopentenylltransferase MiaA
LQRIRELSLLSLTTTATRDFDSQFEDSFQPTHSEIVLDRCIVRAAVGCQHLSESDLRLIASETDLDYWTNKLADVGEACETLRQGFGSQSRTVILITGPSTTGKSSVAWRLAQWLDGVAIALDAFQICAVPPLGLGVGLPLHFPPNHVRSRLYRMKAPSAERPPPEMVAEWVAEAAHDAIRRDLPVVIEGGSSRVATILWERGVPSHTIVFDADRRNAAVRVRDRMLSDGMTPAELLSEARAVRASGLETTWVARESLIYPTVFRCLDREVKEGEMLALISHEWQRLVEDQQQWFADLRSREGVTVLPPDRQSAESIAQILGSASPAARPSPC